MTQAMQSVYDAFKTTANRYPDKPFVQVLPETAEKYRTRAGSHTYAQVLAQVDAQRQAYSLAGYGPGLRVGLLLENRLDFFQHWFALNALGVSVVPINADLRLAELQYLIAHSEVCLIVAIASHHALLNEACGMLNSPVTVILPDAAPPALPASQAGTAAAHAAPGPVSASLVPAEPTEPTGPTRATECALLYTSGTTGKPKGCMLSNQYFLHAGAWYVGTGGLATIRHGEERMLTPLPLVHMNAMAYSVMAMVLSAGCLILLDRFHPRSWWASVRESGATIVHYLGVMPAILSKMPADPADRAHAVRFGFGAGVDKKLHAEFEARFGFPLLEAWAMTETGAGAVIMANHEPRYAGTSCIGREGGDVRVRIVDDTGADVAAGVAGELWVCHAGGDPAFGFFSGYLKDEAATRDAHHGPWFMTGDIVSRNADGYLQFVDRKKNVIRRSGENIAAVEVEGALGRHPAVQAVSVVAVPDALRGDEVLACIVLSPQAPGDANPETTARELVQWSLSQLAYYKVPGYVSFVSQLPLTATNKIQRGEMKTLALQIMQGGRAINTCDLKKPGGMA